MHNIFKDIAKERKNNNRITFIIIISSLILVALMFIYCIYIVNKNYETIYVADNEGTLRYAKIKNIKENRRVEIQAFIKDFINLSFHFTSDIKENQKRLNLANSFMIDKSFKIGYIENLNNSQFWNSLASNDLIQNILHYQEKPLIKIAIETPLSPYTINMNFYTTLNHFGSGQNGVLKHVNISLILWDRERTTDNPHGFLIEGFKITIKEVTQIEE